MHTTANLGAYMSTFSSAVPTFLYATLLSGQYEIPHIYCEVDAVYTNTVPVDAYRGAGRPEATFVVERLVEVGARELGVDPAELRRKNFVRTFPYQTSVASLYDAGDYNASLQKALQIHDYKGFSKRKRESERNGKLRGIGSVSYTHLPAVRAMRMRLGLCTQRWRRNRPWSCYRDTRRPGNLGVADSRNCVLSLIHI